MDICMFSITIPGYLQCTKFDNWHAEMIILVKYVIIFFVANLPHIKPLTSCFRDTCPKKRVHMTTSDTAIARQKNGSNNDLHAPTHSPVKKTVSEPATNHLTVTHSVAHKTWSCDLMWRLVWHIFKPDNVIWCDV